MSSGTTVLITRDDFTPLLARLETAAQAQGLSLVMGRAVGVLVKGWLVDLNEERHKYGRNYYLQASRSVTVNAVPQGAAVSVTQTGLRQRLLGGLIVPKNGHKYLTEPACPEAYGMRAREFHDLDFAIVLDENGALRPALVRRVSQAISFVRRKRGGGTVKTSVKPGDLRGGEVMFWLIKQANQKADPTVLPPGPLLLATALEAGRRRLDRLDARSAGNN